MDRVDMTLCRLLLRLTQAELGAAMGISRKSVSGMENGYHRIDVRTAMACELLLLRKGITVTRGRVVKADPRRPAFVATVIDGPKGSAFVDEKLVEISRTPAAFIYSEAYWVL